MNSRQRKADRYTVAQVQAATAGLPPPDPDQRQMEMTFGRTWPAHQVQLADAAATQPTGDQVSAHGNGVL